MPVNIFKTWYSAPTIVLAPGSLWLRMTGAPYIQMRSNRGTNADYVLPHWEQGLGHAGACYRRLTERVSL